MTYAIPSRRILLDGRWTPQLLGTAVRAWWSTRRPDLITAPGGSVSSWKDIVAGYDAAQSVGASKPIYSATSFNGRPGITFDGADDELTYASTTGLPVGSTGCGVWIVADQLALPANTTTGLMVSWGGSSTTVRRDVRRIVSSGVNRASASIGDNTTTVASTNSTVDFSGRHVVRTSISATAVQTDVDRVAGPSAAVVPATGATRLRIGAAASSVAALFGNFVASDVMIDDGSLSAADIDRTYAYFSRGP